MFADDPSDEIIHRLESIVANDPIHKKAKASRLAYEKKLDERFCSTMSANHPFEHNPKKPSLHP